MKYNKAVKVHAGVDLDYARCAVEYYLREIAPLHEGQFGPWRGGVVRYSKIVGSLIMEEGPYLSVYETSTMYVVRLAQPSKEVLNGDHIRSG